MDNQMTIADIAEALHVSKTTVSRAISGKGRIGDITRSRVLSYIEEHNYKPNIVAQGLAMQKTYNIGVVVPSNYSLVDMPFFLNSVEGLYSIATTDNYDVVWTMCSNTDISSLERIITNRKVDGVILMRTYHHDKAIAYLKDSQVPFVTLGTTEVADVTQVDQDHRGGCMELTGILLMRGMSKIGLIGGSTEHIVTGKRLNGYMDAFREAGMTPDSNLIYENTENPVMIEKATIELLKKQCDCIVCMDDNICGHVLETLSKHNISVPKDIKIASFYNSSTLENHIPSITSLSFDPKLMGMTAGKILIDVINKHEAAPITLLDYQVILRESTKVI